MFKLMKKIIYLLVLLAMIVTINACKKEKNETPDNTTFYIKKGIDTTFIKNNSNEEIKYVLFEKNAHLNYDTVFNNVQNTEYTMLVNIKYRYDYTVSYFTINCANTKSETLPYFNISIKYIKRNNSFGYDMTGAGYNYYTGQTYNISDYGTEKSVFHYSEKYLVFMINKQRYYFRKV